LPLWFFVLIRLRGTVVVRSTHTRPKALGSWIFLARFLRRLDPHLLRVIFGNLRSAGWNLLGHCILFLPFVDRQFVARLFYIDVDVVMGVHAAFEKKVEAEHCKQDNNHDGH
jgi:hypothetical protein